jgi:hypothetical protein
MLLVECSVANGCVSTSHLLLVVDCCLDTQDENFIFYSGYTEAQLEVPLQFLKDLLREPEFDAKFVYKKYSTKKFLKASIFALQWANSER